jgi:hypothetical protein
VNSAAWCQLVDDLEQALGRLALAEIREQTNLLDSLFDERQEEHTKLLKALKVTRTYATLLSCPLDLPGQTTSSSPSL